ncbi:hypothetical protein AXG93_136s1160 [Marchantia polymorpha subsp. ruderalis]|uniref:F-box domain-containing protein n=1 Tax=Marchantia polymorpha subsp. ruderalis TaxID=1480154 RepID=A0A176W682_MARPO|nr:hypothetical protein AXG93_136s1160 [Marchantia polymorpha subsp. ruderalis]
METRGGVAECGNRLKGVKARGSVHLSIPVALVEGGEVNEEGLMMGGRYLSKEVMCRILGRLPARSFLRLRCVCKRWYSIMEDADFKAICASIEFQTSTLCVADKAPFLLWESAKDAAKPLLAFDLLARKWRRFPLLEGPWTKLTVLSSTRGLLLASETNEAGDSDYLTLNPLTTSQRKLPPMIELNNLKFNVRQIVMDGVVEGKYFVIAEELQSKKRGRGENTAPTAPRLQIYDSSTNAWQLAGDLRPGLSFKHAVSMKGSLLCLATSGKEGSDVKSVQGRLMLAGESAAQANNKAVCVWQLDDERMEWVQVQSMPKILPYKTPRMTERLRTAFIHDNFCFYEPRVGAIA